MGDDRLMERSWRTSLVVLVCGCLIMSITFGIRAGFGLFLQPVSMEYHWGREVFSFSIALQNLMWGAIAPSARSAASPAAARRPRSRSARRCARR